MSEMIERVAEAIWRQEFENHDRLPPVEYRQLERTDRLDLEAMARAAIEAMREPTQSMLDAGLNGAPITEYGWCDRETLDIWKPMIDAALKESE
jgi:hypothetical protein